MLLPHSDKKSKPVEVLPPLETPEQIEHAQRQDQALEFRARRRQEENKVRKGEIANERDEFELGRDRTYFAIELITAAILIVACLAVAVVLLATGHGLFALAPLAGTGGLGGLIAVLHQRRKQGGGLRSEGGGLRSADG